MTIEQLHNGPCKTYLIVDEGSKRAVIIDPVLESVPEYLELLRRRGLTLTHTFDTHTHADHVSGGTALKARTGCEYIMHKKADVRSVSGRVEDGDVVRSGSMEITAIFTPGHSMDSMCLKIPGALFTGDTLFLDEGGAGRDDLYTGDARAHAESLERIKMFEGSLVVYPGHDYRESTPSTLFEQKERNPLLRFASADDYVAFSGKLTFGPADWMRPVVDLNIAGTTDMNVLEDPQVAAAREANACEPYEESTEGPQAFMLISPKDLRDTLARGADPVILDVRNTYEFRGLLGALPGAVHIPGHALKARLPELEPSREKSFIVVCGTGHGARAAAALLLQNGFGDVSVLDGGMAAYRIGEKALFPTSHDVIYLDHAATTYLDPKVVQAMEPYFQDRFGNPSSSYSIGKIAGKAIDDARGGIASLLNAKPAELFFTAGGTESINMAIFGVAYSHAPGAHLITTAIEHSAVLNSFKRLETLGYGATYLAVDAEGFVDLKELEAAVRPETVLLSIGYANNEIGTVQPIKSIAGWLKKLNQTRSRKGLGDILLHTDACQAAGYLDVNMRALGADLVTINGSKLYGPKQMGILFVKEGIELVPIIFGGGQERGLRSGTENVPGIVGLATALEIAQGIRKQECTRLRELRDYLIEKILSDVPGSRVNGPSISKDGNEEQVRLPNNVNVSFRDVPGEALLMFLDRSGICVSTGSACHSKNSGPSHVLTAIGCPPDFLEGSLRLTLGKVTTKAQIDRALKVLKKGILHLREGEAAVAKNPPDGVRQMATH